MQSDILRTLAHLQVQDVTCGKTRIGGPGDGGYVMAADFGRSQIAYSIGVGPQIAWDVAMAARGFRIFQYDHTVAALPQQHAAFHFTALGIGPDLSDPALLTLDEMLRRNNHQDSFGLILKIDVEGHEWHCLDALEDGVLAQFDQIVIEYHGLEYLADPPWRERAERVFARLGQLHLPIHVHGNNYAGYHVVAGVPVPGVIEVTYARRGRFAFSPSAACFPTPLDSPCDLARPDWVLGAFRFS